MIFDVLRRRLYPTLLLLLTLAAPCLGGGKAYEIDMSNVTYEQRILFQSLQGIVNKTGPHIFLVYNNNDEDWANYYSSKYGMTFVQLTDPFQLLSIFRDDVKGYVVWDYDNIDELNVATTLAGTNDWLIVHSSLESRVASYGFTMKDDLRGKFTGMTKAQIYSWEFDKYWSECSKKYIASLATGKLNWVNVDLTDYIKGDSVYVRFEDATKNDGNGAKLRYLELTNNNNRIVDFRTGSSDEARYLYDPGQSWFDPDGDRIADRDQYFTYRFKIPNAGKVILKLLVFNQYMVKAGNTPDPASVVASSTEVTGGPGLNEERDMAIYYRCFCFDLSSRESQYPDEYALKEKIMEATDHPSIELGWVSGRDDEGTYVSQASRHGNAVICCGAPNFSFHPWMKPAQLTPPAQLPVPEIDTNKIYVSFLLSDGDALHWDNGFQGDNWFSTGRGTIPFGWELQPLLYDLAPGMLQYYYETATPNDCFVASASGIGYCHPEEFPEGRLDTYLQTTRCYLEATGLNAVSILSATNIPFSVADKYHEYLKGVVNGCEEGYGGRTAGGYPFSDFAVWRTQVPITGLSRDTILLELNNIARLKKRRPLFVPVHPTCYDAGFDDIRWVISQLDTSVFRIVTPVQMLGMISDYYKNTLVVDDSGGVIPTLKEGLVFFPVRFRAITATPIDVTVRLDSLAGGLKAQVFHAQAEQDEESAVEFKLSRPDSGAGLIDSLHLSFNSSLVHKTLTFPSIGLDYRPSQGTYCVYAGSWDAVDMFHRIGKEVQDKDAIGGDAWFTGQNAPGSPNHAVFGPYVALPPGNYVACFRLKTGKLVDGEIANLDVFDLIDNSLVLAQQQISGGDFTAGDTYKFFYLPFHYDGTGSIETRVYATGAADLWTDEIIILRRETIGGFEGPSEGTRGDTLDFTIRAFEPGSDSVSVRFIWGDNDTTAWTAYQQTGYRFEMSHAWLDTGRYVVRYQTRDIQGNVLIWNDSMRVTISDTMTDLGSSTAPPQKFILDQNYPNPFNPSTTISYELPVPCHVTLKVYDILGREAAVLVDRNQDAGSYSLRFNAADLPSGVYFYRLEAGVFNQTRKLLVLK